MHVFVYSQKLHLSSTLKYVLSTLKHRKQYVWNKTWCKCTTQQLTCLPSFLQDSDALKWPNQASLLNCLTNEENVVDSSKIVNSFLHSESTPANFIGMSVLSMTAIWAAMFSSEE